MDDLNILKTKDDISAQMAELIAELDAEMPTVQQFALWAAYLRGLALRPSIQEDDAMRLFEISEYLRSRSGVQAEETTARIDAGVTEINGQRYMMDTKGRMIPLESVRPIDKLMDEAVRKIIGYAEPLAAQVGRFREHSFDDVNGLRALVFQDYGVEIGGTKGNRTLTSYDGTMQVKVQVSDHIAFGPELDAAKTLVDQCLREWSADSRPELRAIIDRAFQVDKEGRLNVGELLGLRRLDIADERWQRAMKALSDSIRVIGSKSYIRAYKADTNGKMQPIVIDVASS